VAQSAEADLLKGSKCRFESDRGHSVTWTVFLDKGQNVRWSLQMVEAGLRFLHRRPASVVRCGSASTATRPDDHCAGTEQEQAKDEKQLLFDFDSGERQ
jgi:hypothetical protein